MKLRNVTYVKKIYVKENEGYEIPSFRNFEITHMFKKDEVFEKEVLCVNRSKKEVMIRVSKKEKERMIMLSEKYFENFEEKYNEVRNEEKDKGKEKEYDRNKEINEYNVNNLGSKQWNNYEGWGESSKNNENTWDEQENMKNWNDNFMNFCNEIDDMNEQRKKDYENEWTEVQRKSMKKRYNGNNELRRNNFERRERYEIRCTCKEKKVNMFYLCQKCDEKGSDRRNILMKQQSDFRFFMTNYDKEVMKQRYTRIMEEWSDKNEEILKHFSKEEIMDKRNDIEREYNNRMKLNNERNGKEFPICMCMIGEKDGRIKIKSARICLLHRHTVKRSDYYNCDNCREMLYEDKSDITYWETIEWINKKDKSIMSDR
jgi:hypothetical protein